MATLTDSRASQWLVPICSWMINKTKLLDGFLADHPNAHLHFTPTYTSWLNQVELWLVERRALRDLQGLLPNRSGRNRWRPPQRDPLAA